MKTVKVTKGNDFCLYIPLVVLNASGAVPVQTSDLSGISVTYKTGCGVAASVIPTYVENYMVLTFPDTLAVGVYSLDITGTYSQRDVRKHINECFAVVEWDSQSNWRDYLVGDHVVTDTQAFLGVLYTNAEYQAKIAELNTKIAQAEAAKAAYEAKVAMLDGVAQQTTLTAVKTETDKIGSASAGKPQTVLGAIEGITQPTDYALGGTDRSNATNTAIVSLIGYSISQIDNI